MASPIDRQWMMPETSESYLRLAGGRDDAHPAEAQVPEADDGAGPIPMRYRFERREHRRFDVEALNVSIDRYDARPDARSVIGRVVDLSAGGVRLRTRQAGIRADQQIRVRLELPDTGGVCPFVAMADGQARPTREWVGWLAVARVRQVGTEFDVAGRLVDMEAIDRGMLGLYLSTQPLAA